MCIFEADPTPSAQGMQNKEHIFILPIMDAIMDSQAFDKGSAFIFGRRHIVGNGERFSTRLRGLGCLRKALCSGE